MNARSKRVLSAFALSAAVVLGPSFDAVSQQRSEAEATLYDRLGGLPALSVVVSDFLDALIPDPRLNQNPAISDARTRVPAPYLKYRVTAFVCQATGGPCQYRGRSMRDSHAHLNITEDEWNRMVTIFREVLAEHDVPERESAQLLELLGSTRADIVTGS